MVNLYRNPYDTLGIERTASGAEIKKAYFQLVRAHPPEREPDVFKQIRAAYEQLRDPEQRAETDMLLLQRWEAPSKRRRLPKIDMKLQATDIVAAAALQSDLYRTDWREYYQKVKV